MKIKIKKGFYWFELTSIGTCCVDYYDGKNDIIESQNHHGNRSFYIHKDYVLESFVSYAKRKLESGEGIYLGG